jgi:hypothetical protein
MQVQTDTDRNIDAPKRRRLRWSRSSQTHWAGSRTKWPGWRIWYWMELNRTTQTREIKCLEVQVAKLVDRIGRP